MNRKLPVYFNRKLTINLGKPETALRCIEERIKSEPDNFLLHSLKFEAHLANAERDKARGMESALIAFSPNSGNPEFRMARLYLKYKDNHSATRLAREAMEKAPENEEIRRLFEFLNQETP